MLYTPYIDWAMEYVEKIYSWNQRVDEMRSIAISPIGWYNKDYHFNNGLRLLYEEKNEYTEAKLSGDIEEQVDALIDQFVVAIWEIRKCSLSDSYEHIEFWEDEANYVYNYLHRFCIDTSEKRLESISNPEIPVSYNEVYKIWNEIMHKAIIEVIDALFTRFGDDAYIDESWKFIKSKSYRKPDLSFLTKYEN